MLLRTTAGMVDNLLCLIGEREWKPPDEAATLKRQGQTGQRRVDSSRRTEKKTNNVSFSLLLVVTSDECR